MRPVFVDERDGSHGEARRGPNEDVPESFPQRKNTVIRDKMAAQASVLAAVQFDMFDEEMTERAERGLIPIFGCQHRAKDFLQSAILIARQAHRPRDGVELLDLRKVCAAEALDPAPLVPIEARHGDGASHELVVVHFLPRFGYARIGRQVVRVAFPLAEFDELGIRGIKSQAMSTASTNCAEK